MARQLTKIQDIHMAEDYESYIELLDELSKKNQPFNDGNAFRFEFSSNEAYNPNLLASAEPLADYPWNVQLDYQYKGSTDSNVTSTAKYDSGEITIGELHPTDIMHYGRVCISINAGRQVSIGKEWITNDTANNFVCLVGLGSQSTIRLYYASTSSGTPSSIVITGEGDLAYPEMQNCVRASGDSYTGPVTLFHPSTDLYTGSDLATSNNDAQLSSCHIYLGINIPLFYSNEDAEEFVRTGSLAKAVNDLNARAVMDRQTWYIQNTIYKEGYSTTTDKTKRFARWRIGSARICLYLHQATGKYNMTLKSNATSIQESWYPPLEEEYKEQNWTEFKEVDDFRYYDFLKGEAPPWIGKCITNIPIFENEADADEFLRTGDMSKAINKSNTRKNLTGSEFEDDYGTSGSAEGCTVYALTKADVMSLMGYLHSDTKAEPLKGLLWGENVSNGIIDFYLADINAMVFGGGGTRSKLIKIGNVGLTVFGTELAEVYHNHEPYICSVDLLGTHGDWKDYECTSYRLFLPYVGWQDIPSNWIGHTLSIRLGASILCRAVRYTLYIDGYPQMIVDGTQGIEVPFSAENFAGKSREFASATMEAVGGLAGTVASAGLGNAVGFVAGAGAMTKGVTDMLISAERHTAMMNQGSINVNMNVVDSKCIYLLIDEQLTIEPVNLNATWNYPSYIIGSIGSCNGYVEAQDIRLKTNATRSEIDEIIALVNAGIIV